jgi:hypothetical protein
MQKVSIQQGRWIIFTGTPEKAEEIAEGLREKGIGFQTLIHEVEPPPPSSMNHNQ